MKLQQDGNPFLSLKIVERAPEKDWKPWLNERLSKADDNVQRGEELMQKFCGQEGPTIFKHESRLQSRKKIEIDRTGDDEDPHMVRVVAIGPYHRNCEHSTKFDDDYKWKIVRYMAQQHGLDPVTYLEAMETKEGIARTCYSSSFPEQSSIDFRVMLLLDSAFILFAMDAFGEKNLCSENLLEYMGLYIEVWESIKQIKLDFLMLSNQIPFFAIDQLYVISGGFANNLSDLALSCFDDLYPRRNRERRIMDHGGDYFEFYHLLHLFHWSRVTEGKYEMDSGSQLYKKNDLQLYIPSATELRKSSTIFRKTTLGSSLDISFEERVTEISGEMTIPIVHLHDYSKHIFRNLIAFETSCTNSGRCVTAYSLCMSHILQREDDVKLLRGRGILASTNYKDADVVKFFENFSKQIEGQMMPDDLLQLYTKVTEHHKRRISNCCGELKLRYFPNPWITFSLVGAFILFLLSLVQTIYSMLSYYQGNKTTK